MENQDILEDKVKTDMKNRAQRIALKERLRAMGFSEEEIKYNFSSSIENLFKYQPNKKGS